MAEEKENGDLEALRELVGKNTEAIEKLHELIENMEVLLAGKSGKEKPKRNGPKNDHG